MVAQTPAPSTREPAARETREIRGYTLSPDRYRQAVAYSRAKYRLHFIGFAWELLILVALVAARVAPQFRNLAERVSRRRFVQALVFVPLLLMIVRILDLPIDAWGHRLSVFYGQSVQSWASWLWDWLKAHLIGLLVFVPVVWLLYGILRGSPRRWWLWFWLATIPIIVFVTFIAPVLIDPLFYEFEPLDGRKPDLVTQIEKVTRRGGLEIPRHRIFLMEASKKLKSVNAYVTGFGASERVVVWDTTLEKMNTPQTLFVFGHEMGHYVLKHIPKTIAFVAALMFVMLFLGDRALRRAFRPGLQRWGVRGVTDWASLPLLLLLASIFAELSLPAVNGYSRANEHAADVYGIEVIHGVVPDVNRAAAEAFQILGEINLSDPSPGRFVRFWLYSHPPLADRLAFAATYDPWSKGERPRYVREERP